MRYIGFDIGGTKCAVSLGRTETSGGSKALVIEERAEVATEKAPEKTLEALAPYVREYLKEADVKGAGISCGGPLDAKRGILLTPPNLPGWHGFDICGYIEKNFALTSRLCNDANACALAEWKYGAGRGKYKIQNRKKFLFLIYICLESCYNKKAVTNSRRTEQAQV